jgi:iron(II)-dependent oxidoreductase
MLLAEARERTIRLVVPLSEDGLHRQHSPLMSPIVWDLAHIAAFEDLWLCHRAGGGELLRPELAELYDAFETPRARRSELPLLRAPEARAYLDAVRERALAALEHAGGFFCDLVVQHEHQHNETMLQALKLAPAGVYAPERRPLPPAPAASPDGMARVPAGPFLLGDGGDGFAYDNERPQHEIELAAFEIDRGPVTNGAYLQFLDQGGYRRRELWSEDGWAWRREEAIEAPLCWTAAGGVRDFERTLPLDARLPVQHVSWFEAEAFARWAGKRLPTEAEWEKAASWDPEAEAKRAFPWGDEPAGSERANLDQLAFGPAPAGAYPAGASAYGALGLLGDCWEWTASAFGPYPGFSAFPYREYSEVFFGDRYRVLRGGSWATRPRVARATFRNWDHPHRRQIFAGFRCARDA